MQPTPLRGSKWRAFEKIEQQLPQVFYIADKPADAAARVEVASFSKGSAAVQLRMAEHSLQILNALSREMQLIAPVPHAASIRSDQAEVLQGSHSARYLHRDHVALVPQDDALAAWIAGDDKQSFNQS
ncbi:hypothetical protein [Streptomyces sp. NPDC047972]|uniref:hypothetical protein n=1 Tax=Streptomyces sp. NPDC047972 TaxID=3365493 RepID=UPI00371B9833